MHDLNQIKITIIGLGYIGLPLAIAFNKKNETIGFDINPERINQLQQGIDNTQEISSQDLFKATNLEFTADKSKLNDSDIYIITVPTPVTDAKVPNLQPIEKASELIAPYLKKDNIVIYESTVYPGATKERCIPILTSGSGLEYNKDFFVGYSPERANPGDTEHGLANIIKVVSGSTPKITKFVAELYSKIVPAGIHQASSIEVAEAAKVIENIQRDINIALVNELTQIFSRLNIDTQEVLEAAGTKWNFLPFKPGLVGGHCIGVDPYYLTYKAQMAGFHPEMILAGRRINDSMGRYITQEVIRLMLKKCIQVNGAHILIMGLTFKENCPDIRNTRVIDIIKEFQEMNVNIDIHDPWADSQQAAAEYDLQLCNNPPSQYYEACIVAVAHDIFKEAGIKKIRSHCKKNHVIYDVKYAFPADKTDDRL